MQKVRDEFQKRITEIEAFLLLLKDIEVRQIKLSYIDEIVEDIGILNNLDISANKIEKAVDNLSKATLKSSAILLLYNLLESIVRAAIEEIHITINSKEIKFKDVIIPIQQIWLSFHYENFKNRGSESILRTIDMMQNDVIAIDYSKFIAKSGKNDLSGNVDARKVRELADKIYGFKSNSNNTGSKLKDIKRIEMIWHMAIFLLQNVVQNILTRTLKN